MQEVIIFVYCLGILLLIIGFLFVMHQKKQNRNTAYIANRMSFLRRRFSYMTLTDNNYLAKMRSKIELYIKKLSEKNERIKMLEDLIYGNGKRLGGITLPPLDLTQSGIFCVK